jgi:tape measure domain-containing protein
MPEKVGIEVYVDPTKAKSGSRQAEDALSSLERQANDTSRQFTVFNGVAAKLGVVLAGAITVDMARRVIGIADDYKILQQRIKTATAATGDYSKVSERLYDIAQQNGTQLAANIDLFQKLKLATKSVGASSDDVLVLTKAVQQLGLIGGSTQDQLNNALLQFSQGLAGGIFRAEEFNSIIENTPLIADRIAIGLNMSVGELRKAVIDGKLLSKDVFGALMRQAPEVNKEFEAIPTNLERAFTKLSNGIATALGTINEDTGFTQGLATIIDQMADGADVLTNAYKKYAAQDKTEIEKTFERIAMFERLYRESGKTNYKNAIELERNKLAELVKLNNEAIAKDAEAYQEKLDTKKALDKAIADKKAISDAKEIESERLKLQKKLIVLQDALTQSEQMEQAHEDRRYESTIQGYAADLQKMSEHLQNNAEIQAEYGNLIETEWLLHLQRKQQITIDAETEAKQRLAEQEQINREEVRAKWDEEILLLQGFNSQKEYEEYAHKQRLAAIQLKHVGASKAYMLELVKWEKLSGKDRAANALGMFATMTRDLSTNSKTMFEISKKLSIAQTVIETYQAAQGAYAALSMIPYVGPALGIAASAAAIASGMARVNAIKSQSFDSGGVSAGGSFSAPSAASINAPVVAPVATNPHQSTADQKPPTVINIYGDVGDESAVEKMAELFQEALDRDYININIA